MPATDAGANQVEHGGRRDLALRPREDHRLGRGATARKPGARPERQRLTLPEDARKRAHFESAGNPRFSSSLMAARALHNAPRMNTPKTTRREFFTHAVSLVAVASLA